MFLEQELMTSQGHQNCHDLFPVLCHICGAQNSAQKVAGTQKIFVE